MAPAPTPLTAYRTPAFLVAAATVVAAATAAELDATAPAAELALAPAEAAELLRTLDTEARLEPAAAEDVAAATAAEMEDDKEAVLIETVDDATVAVVADPVHTGL